MKLYLVRHGIAEDVSPDGADRSRRLTTLGADRARASAAGLSRTGCKVTRIVSSPLRRAVETAHIFAEELHLKNPVEEEDALAADGDITDMLAWLRTQPRVPTMLVGHMPSLSLLVTCLIWGRAEAIVRLKKAGVCLVTVDNDMLPGAGVLEWLLPPAFLRRVDGASS